MRLYSGANTVPGLVDNLYSISQQNIEAAYQRDMEPYADGNRLFRICTVGEFFRSKTTMSLAFVCSSKMIVE